MNDFTKEELEIIHLDMTVYAKRWYPLKEAQNHQDLRDKLQSMIDNYCEHDGKIGKDYPGEKCMKCRRMWE
jgi:hypothetical protein